MECGDNVTDEKIERLHKELANKELFGIEPQYITPITMAEYNENNEDEQNADDDGDWDDDEEDFVGDDDDDE